MRLTSSCILLIESVLSTTPTLYFHDMVFDFKSIDRERVGISAFGPDGSSGYVGLSLYGRRQVPHHTQVSESVNLVNITGQLNFLNMVRTRPVMEDPAEFRIAHGYNFGSLDLSPGREFSNNYSHLFISKSPRSTSDEEQFQLAIAPADAFNEYCQESSMWFTPMITDNYMRMRAQLALVESGSDYEVSEPIAGSIVEPRDYILMFYEGISIPRSVRDVIDQFIHARLNMTWSEFQEYPGCESMINQLPTVRYTLPRYESTETETLNVHIEPSDYVSVSEEDPQRCRINLHSTASTNFVGRPLFKSAGVYINYPTQMLGFCDPL